MYGLLSFCPGIALALPPLSFLKRVVCFSILTCVIVGFVSLTAFALPPGNWQLTWSDEFNGAVGSAPDPTKWYVYPYASTGNAGYRTDPANVYLDGEGHLILKVGPKDHNGFYTLGFVSTHQGKLGQQTVGLFSQTYGYFEARIKGLARQDQGYWGAFWMISNELLGSDGELPSVKGAETLEFPPAVTG